MGSNPDVKIVVHATSHQHWRRFLLTSAPKNNNDRNLSLSRYASRKDRTQDRTKPYHNCNVDEGLRLIEEAPSSDVHCRCINDYHQNELGNARAVQNLAMITITNSWAMN